MKKLMAWFLAAFLLALPMQAPAEGAQSLILTMETDAERLSPLVTALSGKDNPALCESLAELLNSCVLEGAWQEDATLTAFTMKGEKLLEFAASYAGEKTTFVTNMVPGYAMETMTQPTIDWNALAQLDWTEEAARLTEKLEILRDSLEWTEETGSFLGDAYEGGVRRVTYGLDDRDIYLLAECVLTTLEGSEAFVRATAVRMEEMHTALAQLRESMLPGALENVYRYRLSLVYDADDTLTGISLTALERDQQISTFSLGPVEDGLATVWGYGKDGVNYYLRLILLAGEAEDSTRTLSVHLSVLEDPMHMGYAMVSRLDGSTAEEHMLSMAFTPAAEGAVFMGEYQVTTPADSVTLSWNGEYAADPFSINAVADVYAFDRNASLMTLLLTTGVSEALAVDMEGLTVLDIDAIDTDTEAEMDEVLTQAATDFCFKLFRLMPAELLILLMQ